MRKHKQVTDGYHPACPVDVRIVDSSTCGLTKRERMALDIFCCLFSFDKDEVNALAKHKPNHRLAANTAVNAADTLIAALNQEKP